jgi:HD-like signal output (HDOD) protein
MQESQLIEELRRLPLRPSSVTRVLAVLEDPGSSAAAVAHAVSPDVGLCVRILHLANSPYFGASGRVGSLERAVVTLGHSVVRSLAITTAAGLTGASARVPAGFWAHSGATGVAASRLAPRFGLSSSDTLCAGLLHDLGSALAFQHDPKYYEELLHAPSATVLEQEHCRFGADHAELGGIALAAWHLPAGIVDAITQHHGGFHPDTGPLTQAVVAAEALVHVAMGERAAFGNEPEGDPDAVLAKIDLRGDELESLAALVAEDAEHLAALVVSA